MGMLITIIFFLLSFPRLSSLYDHILISFGMNLDERIVSKLSILVVIAIFAFWGLFNYKYLATKFNAWFKIRENKFVLFAGMFFLGLSYLSGTNGIAFATSLITVAYWALIFIVYLLLTILWKKSLSLKLIAISLYITFVVSIVQMLSYHYAWHWDFISSLFNVRGMVDLSGFTLKSGSTWILRPSGFMNDPNFLSIYLSICLVYLFREFGDVSKKAIKSFNGILEIFKAKAFYLCAFIFGFINLILTASRTGIIIFIVGIITYVLFRFAWRKSHKALYSGFFIQLADRFKFNDVSFFEHLKYAQVALQIFIEKPIWGIGAGNYPLYYKLHVDKRVDFGTPHSTYLKVLAETGIMGTISFAAVLLLLLYRLLKSKYIVGIAVFITILASAVAYDSLLTPWVWMFVAMIVSDIAE